MPEVNVKHSLWFRVEALCAFLPVLYNGYSVSAFTELKRVEDHETLMVSVNDIKPPLNTLKIEHYLLK